MSEQVQSCGRILQNATKRPQNKKGVPKDRLTSCHFKRWRGLDVVLVLQ